MRIPNSSEVSLAETVQSSFLPRHGCLSHVISRKFGFRCAQKSLRFGQRRSARRHGPGLSASWRCLQLPVSRPGLELREAEAKGLAKHRGVLELEPSVSREQTHIAPFCSLPARVAVAPGDARLPPRAAGRSLRWDFVCCLLFLKTGDLRLGRC